MPDPTRSLTDRSPDQLGEFIDTHLLMALAAGDLLTSDRQTAEDYLRDRLVALSDTHITHESVTDENSRRTIGRLRELLTDAG